MKAVRIKFHQDTAQFRNPLMNGKNRTTFPLPPYSTMIGMVHRLCKWDTTHTINVSVMCTNERLSSPQVDRSYGWIGGNPFTFHNVSINSRPPATIISSIVFLLFLSTSFYSPHLTSIFLL